MVKVKNIQVEDIPFIQLNDNFKKCMEYIKAVAPDSYNNCIPKKSKQKLSFELVETNVDVANTIRRFLLDEIPVISMYVNDDNIITDDRYILVDKLKKSIELLRISQNIPETATCTLDIENNTDNIINIYSRDIVITNKSKLNTDDYIVNTVPIEQLRAGCKLSITDITMIKGLGKNDSGKFLLLSNLSYEILDVIPFDHDKFGKTGQSSMLSDPAHFKITLTNHRNVDLKDVMLQCCDLIISRIQKIESEIQQIKDTSYISEVINIEVNANITIVRLIGEYWTIANIISRYCYIVCNDIQFVSPGIFHPSTEEAFIKIRHPQYKKILIDALKKILSEFIDIKKAFN